MEPIPEKMRGVMLTGHGDLDVLEVRGDIPVPKPERGDVLIRVSAAAVNNTDINARTAWYSKTNDPQDAAWDGAPFGLPRIQGIDVCGMVVAVGSGVSDSRIGERVLVEPCLREVHGEAVDPPWFLGSECDGGFAEYTVVAARHAYRIDSGLSDVGLASFPCSYSTAENLLSRAGVGRGDHVVVTGASGGVGSASIQLAKARGARVTAVTSQSKQAALRDLGADKTISREDDVVEEIGPEGADVVIDLVGGPGFPPLLDVLRRGGHYAVAGAIAGPVVDLDLRTLYLKDLTLHGATALDEGVFDRLIDRIEAGQIIPVVAQTYPLEKIADAQRAFLAKEFVGKIVLTVAR